MSHRLYSLGVLTVVLLVVAPAFAGTSRFSQDGVAVNQIVAIRGQDTSVGVEAAPDSSMNLDYYGLTFGGLPGVTFDSWIDDAAGIVWSGYNPDGTFSLTTHRTPPTPVTVGSYAALGSLTFRAYSTGQTIQLRNDHLVGTNSGPVVETITPDPQYGSLNMMVLPSGPGFAGTLAPQWTSYTSTATAGWNSNVGQGTSTTASCFIGAASGMGVPAVANSFVGAGTFGELACVNVSLSGIQGMEEWPVDPGDPGGGGMMPMPIPAPDASGALTGSLLFASGAGLAEGTPIDLRMMAVLESNNFRTSWSCNLYRGTELLTTLGPGTTDQVTRVFAGETGLNVAVTADGWGPDYMGDLTLWMSGTPVPEPMTILLLSLGTSLFLKRR